MSKDTRTYKDRREYNIKAVVKRRREIRLKAIAEMGGKRPLPKLAKSK